MELSGPMRILLVEDSAIERQQVSAYLKDLGLNLVVAENAPTHRRCSEARMRQPLAQLDRVLPGLDGIELCRRIRTLGSNGTYNYTVMLTAKDRKKNLLTAMDAGADDYLAKPVDLSEWKACILVGKRILDLQQSLRFSATHDFLTGS